MCWHFDLQLNQSKHDTRKFRRNLLGLLCRRKKSSMREKKKSCPLADFNFDQNYSTNRTHKKSSKTRVGLLYCFCNESRGKLKSSFFGIAKNHPICFFFFVSFFHRLRFLKEIFFLYKKQIYRYVDR